MHIVGGIAERDATRRSLRARREVDYRDPPDERVDASELLGVVSAADLRAASARIRSRLGLRRDRVEREFVPLGGYYDTDFELDDARREALAEREREALEAEREREREALEAHEAEREREADEAHEREREALEAEREAVEAVEHVAAATTAPAATCLRVYNAYKYVTGGADGALGPGYGMNGSLTYPSMCAVLRALGVGAHTTFVDIGAAEGRALACAAALGAPHVIGYELPETARNHEAFFTSVFRRLRLTARVQYIHRSISTVASLEPGSTCVYTFWDGFHPDDIEHTIELIAQCPSVRSACVFLRDDTAAELEELFAANGKQCVSSTIIKVKMFGSRERKSALVLHF